MPRVRFGRPGPKAAGTGNAVDIGKFQNLDPHLRKGRLLPAEALAGQPPHLPQGVDRGGRFVASAEGKALGLVSGHIVEVADPPAAGKRKHGRDGLLLLTEPGFPVEAAREVENRLELIGPEDATEVLEAPVARIDRDGLPLPGDVLGLRIDDGMDPRPQAVEKGLGEHIHISGKKYIHEKDPITSRLA